MTTPQERMQRLMQVGEEGTWLLAALTIALRGGGDSEAAASLLQAVGVDLHNDLGEIDRGAAAAQAASPLLQAAAMLNGGDQWNEQSDQALLAQGKASSQGAALSAQFIFPMLAGLSEALAQRGARMLDVGTGVAALAVAYAELFPELTVVGLDVMPRVLKLAAETVAASSVADRVILREQDVSTLDDADVYTLAWLPAPFLPEAALRAGVQRVAAAMLPGGWVMMAHGKFAGDPLAALITRFKTVAYGGTALDGEEAQQLLREAGFGDVASIPTPPGAPAFTVGRKPA